MASSFLSALDLNCISWLSSHWFWFDYNMTNFLRSDWMAFSLSDLSSRIIIRRTQAIWLRVYQLNQLIVRRPRFRNGEGGGRGTSTLLGKKVRREKVIKKSSLCIHMFHLIMQPTPRQKKLNGLVHVSRSVPTIIGCPASHAPVPRWLCQCPWTVRFERVFANRVDRFSDN